MLAVIGLIFGAVALGIRIPGNDLLAGLPRLTQPDNAMGALGPLAPISEDYARRTLGEAAYRGPTRERAAETAGLDGRLGRPASPPAGGG